MGKTIKELLEIERNKTPEVTKRVFPLTEIRLEQRTDGKMPKIIGHAAVFNKLSLPLSWGYREKVMPGCFKKTIQEADVRSLFNHDVNKILGRTKSGTLELSEDETGLNTITDPAPTTCGKDLVISIERGDVDQMSFSFVPVIAEWDETNPDEPVRKLVEVKLYDISPVVFPAYPDTDVAVRSILEKRNIDFPVLSRAIGKSTYGMPLSPEEIAAVRSTIEILQGIHGPAQEDHPGEPADTGIQLRMLRNKLELIAVEV